MGGAALSAAAAAALVLDLLVGEPPARLHPVVWIGAVIGALRRRAPGRGRFLAGLGLALVVPLGFASAAHVAVQLPWIGWPIAVWLVWGCFSIRVLGEAGLRVGDAVARVDVQAAREGLGWLCSRDPSQLDGPSLAAAAVESVAENASDSAVAPAFWLVVGGVPALVAYRCLNTLDAMVGYRDRYPWFGKASARLDDVANLIPARLTAGLLVLLGGGRSAARTAWRDAGLTDSPNAGWPMAAMAGALGVRLEKQGQYVLLPEGRAVRGEDLRPAWALARRAMVAAWLLAILASAVLGAR